MPAAMLLLFCSSMPNRFDDRLIVCLSCVLSGTGSTGDLCPSSVPKTSVLIVCWLLRWTLKLPAELGICTPHWSFDTQLPRHMYHHAGPVPAWNQTETRASAPDRLKPWDVCAGVLIAREAGSKVTTMEGEPFTVFDRSVLAAAPGMQEVCLCAKFRDHGSYAESWERKRVAVWFCQPACATVLLHACPARRQTLRCPLMEGRQNVACNLVLSPATAVFCSLTAVAGHCSVCHMAGDARKNEAGDSKAAARRH